MCAISKKIVPLDGEGSDACSNYREGFHCANCVNFSNPDKYGIGTCSGFERENWAYAQNGAFCCEHYSQA
jgi:hypothetical protein